MPEMRIVRDGDGLLSDVPREKIVEGTLEGVGRLRAGMVSGASSVALRIQLDDGRVVFAQTSMKLFLAAADALRGFEAYDAEQAKKPAGP